MFAILLLILAGLIALFRSLSGDTGEITGIIGDNIGYLAGLLALGLLYLATLGGDYQGRRRDAIRHAATWLGIGLALIVGYTYREELRTVVYRVAGEVLPSTPEPQPLF